MAETACGAGSTDHHADRNIPTKQTTMVSTSCTRTSQAPGDEKPLPLINQLRVLAQGVLATRMSWGFNDIGGFIDFMLYATVLHRLLMMESDP